MPVSKTNDVSDHAHNSCGSVVGLNNGPPFRGTRGPTPQFPAVVST